MIKSTPFTDGAIFNNPIVNATCDRLLNLVEFYKPEDNLNDFSFYGKAAKVLQGEPLTSVKNISFITGRLQIYRVILEKINTEFKEVNLTAFKTYSVIDLGDVIVEVYKSPSIIATVDVQGVQCYNYADGAQDGQPKDSDPKPGEENYQDIISSNQESIEQ